MYAALLARRMEEIRRNLWRIAVMRSGLLILTLMTLTVLGLALGWSAHRQGRFSKLKQKLKQEPATPQSPAAARPGGQDAIVLQRTRLEGQDVPEFLTATVLPGRGMNVLQITAYLPNKGEVSLLASPTLDEAGRSLNGTGLDAIGEGSLSVGAAFEAPWANRIFGTPSRDRHNTTVEWHGHSLGLPVSKTARSEAVVAIGGLLLNHGTTSASTNVMPDGGAAQAIFEAGDFGGHWVSRTEITTSVQLSSRAVEIRIAARNTGDEPEPMGLGWHPRFAILSGDRGHATLHMPNALRSEVRDRQTGLPTGKLLPVTDTPYDFTTWSGRQLGELSLDDSFVHLRPALLDNGPIAELRDPKSNYGLRITAITPTIKAMRVYAPASENFVSIEPQFNYDDPFGTEWPRQEDTGMVVLQPGQSVQWQIRLEIFSLDPGRRFDPAQP
jgi:aldose 1-epimerase